jgi:hypothetical protein
VVKMALISGKAPSAASVFGGILNSPGDPPLRGLERR